MIWRRRRCRQGKERSMLTAAKMNDNKSADSTEKDISRIFKDMSYATVQEGCSVAEVRDYYDYVYLLSFHSKPKVVNVPA